MKKHSVTSELRKSIAKVTKYPRKLDVFSDSRKDKKAVGVKVVGFMCTHEEEASIVKDMESKGFKLDYISYNEGGYGFYTGTRFCFYNR